MMAGISADLSARGVPAVIAIEACGASHHWARLLLKTAERQAALMLVGLRDRLIRNRTQLANAIRGYAAEFGLAAAKGIAHLAVC
jgi:transposase